MKTSQHPVWKRFVSILLVVLMLMPSVGMTAVAEELPEEELVLAEELPEELPEEHEHRDDDAPVPEAEILIEEAAAEEAVVTDEWLEEEALPTAELPEVPEAVPEAEALESEEIALETEREGDPGTVRILAADGVFPAGAVLCVTSAEVPALQAGETLSFESGGEPEEKDEIICDEEIPDGDEILVVNPRRADADAQYSVTREVVASYCYEIHMSGDDGEVLQPAEGQSVTLAFDLPEAAEKDLDVRVLHYPADGAAEELPARVEDGTVYAETTGFSAFVIEFTRTDRRYTVTSSVPEAVKNIVDNVVTEEKNLYVVYASSSNPNLVKTYKDMGIWFVEVPWSFNETVTLTVGTSPNQGDVSATAEYEIKISVHQPAISYKKLGKTEECIKYTLMSSISERVGMTLKDGWYVVDKNVTFEKNRLTVLGDVHLILLDGCTLTCKYGIRTATQVDPNTSLSIYAEDRGTGLLRCEVNYDRRTTESFYAGIGGNRDEDGCKITVYGGEIKAVGAIQGAAIGGGTGGSLLGFTMYDGSVTVKGKKGAGVGGGKDGTIKGPIAIHGGLLTAQSLSDDNQDPINYSAAVGAGEGRNLGADIIIDGGVVIAHAHNGGPGIGDCGITSGGRRTDDNGAVYIKGGHVMASGVDGAGIGAGLNGIERGGTGCTVNISGGFVEAVSSGRGAGIGGSYKGNGGTVNISGGYVIARGKDVEVPFGHGHKWLTVEKQNSAARAGLEFIGNLLIEALTRKQYGGAGIGGGDSGNGGTVTISGGTILAAGGRTECKAIGQGMQGESKGIASITNDNLRIQYGWDMNKLVETTRKDGDKWHNITREQRSKLLTFDSIVYISPCTHVDMPYRSLNANYHERVCNTCLYYEHVEPHDFDDKGICRKCLYNRNDKPVEYNVWYLGTRITSENMERLHYDPFTNTLTIPEKVDGRLWGSLKNGALIYAEGDLNISGNAWISPQDNPAEYGVYVKGGTLTFKEDCSLSFLASKYGVYAPDGLKIEKVKELSFYTRDGGTGAYFGDKPPVVHEEVAMKTPEYGKAGSGTIVDKDGKTAKDVCFVRGLTLRFDADGAVGTPEPMKGLVKNREYTLPEGKPRRQNFDFLDWNINGNLYAEGMQFSISGDTTAKAVWQAHAHTWKAPVWEWKKDDSGRWLATAMFVCSECNELKQVAASVFTNTVPARCEKAGSITYLASVRALGGANGEYNDSRSETLPAIGHRWGEWKVTTEATTEHAGEKTRVCLNDKSHVETEIIARLHSHSMVRVARKEPVCVIPGNIEYWLCTGCGKYFADAEGKSEIDRTSVILPPTGQHNIEATKTVTKEATCTERGEYQYRERCRDCGQLIQARSDWEFPLGHDWGEWTVVREATETQEGQEMRTCRRDPSHTETRPIPRKEHVHSLSRVEAAAPGCTEPGHIEYWLCTGCGKLFADARAGREISAADTVLSPLGHTAADEWTRTEITKQPGCTEPGYERQIQKCKVCGAVLNTRDVEISPHGHSWGAWTVITPATEEEEGSEQRSCSYDESHIEVRSIPKKQHEHRLTKINAAEPTCLEPGHIEYWRCAGCGRLFADEKGEHEITQSAAVLPARGHTPESEWTLAGGRAPTCESDGVNSFEQHCAVCGAVIATRTERVAALGHAWGAWSVTRAATETAEGIETRTCARCGSTQEHSIPRLEHRHSMTKIDAVEPSCTEGGSIACYRCSGCGKLYADAAGKTEIYESDIRLPANGHRAESSWRADAVTKEPGCTDQGFVRMKLYCADCGAELSSRGEPIAPVGHSWEAWETTLEPTETQEGKQIRVCHNDPEKHVEERSIPVLQHTHIMTAVPAKAAGCTEPGNSAYYRCTGCGHYFADAEGTKPVEPEDMLTDPLGHSAGEWSEGKVEKTAKCTETGIRSYNLFCARCGEALTTRTERIPALGHAWGEWKTLTPATEEAEGTEIRTCAHDGEHTETRTTPRLAHTHRMKEVPTVEPSCLEPGSIAYYACTGCGRLFADAGGQTELSPESIILPPKGHAAAEAWTSEELAPTCTAPGYTRLTLHCADCGEVLSTRGMAIPATGHSWGAWETVKEATEVDDGLERRICAHDPAHIQTREIPALGHTHKMTPVAEKAPTCTEAGNRAYYRCTGCELCFLDAEGNTWISEEDTVLAPLGHRAGVWKEESSTAPGCTEPGEKNFALRCTACGAVLTERSELIPATGHDWGEASYRWSDDCSVVIAERRCRNDGTHIQEESCDKIEITTPIPAGCEEEGVRLYRAVFENPAFVSEKTQTIPAIGHDWGDWEITTPATETEDGEQTRICRNDPSHVQTSVIPRLTHVHRLSAVPAKEPTCTEEGNKAYWICDQGDYPCEGVFTDAEGKNAVAEEDFGTLFLAPLGHSWKLDSVEWTDDLRSALFFFTCLRDGSHTREVLGEVLEEPVLTPPTETEDGKLSYTATAVLDGESYRATKDVVVRREPAFKTHSLILSGEIGVHFYIDLPALEGVDYSESYMSFRVKDMEKRVDFDPNRKNDAGTYYCFTCYVPSIMMAQPITATFHYGEDQTVEQTYTIMEYIQAFEKRSGDFPAATQRVVEALADFGHYIQPFLSDVRGWKIGTDYSEMTEHFKEPYSEAEIAAVSEAVADRAIVRDPGDSQIRKVSYNLVLDSETAIRVYLKPKSGYEGEVTATLDGGAENVAEAQSDGRYLVTIPNISAHQLGDTHIIRVTAGSSFTVEVSALSYIQSILSSDQYKADQNARNAMAALYEYYCAVTAAKEGGVRK